MSTKAKWAKLTLSEELWNEIEVASRRNRCTEEHIISTILEDHYSKVGKLSKPLVEKISIERE